MKFNWRQQIGSDGKRTEQIFTFKFTLYVLQLFLSKLIDIVNFNYCTSFEKVD